MQRLRDSALTVVLIVAFLFFAVVLGRHQPLQHWLPLRYVGYAAVVACWTAGVTGTGLVLLRVLRVTDASSAERLALAAGLGVLAFFLAITCVGHLGALGPVSAVSLPLLFCAVGGRELSAAIRDARAAAPRSTDARCSVLCACALAFGALGVIAIYLEVILPENAGWDARWYHLGIAEHYASAGRITRFADGWWVGAYPQLASLLYTWCFTLPWGGGVTDAVLLSAQLELALFLLTLLGTAALALQLLPDMPLRHAWAATFLFPGILIYDSNLNLGADHVTAFWSPPILLATLRAWRRLDVRNCVLLGLFAGAAVATKYSALLIVAGPGGAVMLRAAWLARGGARASVPGVLACGLAASCASAPHWLKNLVFYGDPLYPISHRHLAVTPWGAEVAYRYSVVEDIAWSAPHAMAGLWQTALALVTFSFAPHDWEFMHGKLPVFGSLFTVSLLLLPFVRGAGRRLWITVLFVHVGIALWYWLDHKDRFLQALLPWMVASTVCVLALMWRTSVLARAIVVVLVCLQIAWGARVYFLPTHSNGESPIARLSRVRQTAARGDYRGLLHPFAALEEVGAAIPKGAVVLFHDEGPQLGLAHVLIHDSPLHQGALTYGRMHSVQAVARALRALGVTYIVYRESARWEDSLAGEIVFREFAARALLDVRIVSGYRIARLPDRVPDFAIGDDVVFLGCGLSGYGTGHYRREALNVIRWDPRPLTGYPHPERPLTLAAAPSEAPAPDYVLVDRRCALPLPSSLAGHHRLGRRDEVDIFARDGA